MKRISALTILLAALAFPAAAQEYADGIYRGFYYDGGIEQIAIQFELKDGRFDSLVYRGVKYKDGDYMSEDSSRRAESHPPPVPPACRLSHRQRRFGHRRPLLAV